MIIKLAEFVSGCPYLQCRTVGVNCLEKSYGSVSVEMTKNKRTIREYADGGALKMFTFVIALREAFAVGNTESRRIAEKCSLVEKWIEEQNINGFLPKLDGEVETVSIGVSKCFELVHTDGISARYAAEIEVAYYEELKT